MLSSLRVAFVHYWLLTMRGGEKVLEDLCNLFPQADIFTLVVDPSSISEKLRQHRITSSFVQKIPGVKRHYQALLPLYPLALEQFDLSGYDLVISSESGPAKGVLTRPETCHICYCHTPMRYLWDMYHDYLKGAGPVKKLLMPWLCHYLRQWDQASANRVDYFVANSKHVAKRITKHYRRDADVIHPPVEADAFSIAPKVDDFYLMVGQLVQYKRPDIAIQAFSKNEKPLVVIGEGEGLVSLKKMAGPNIKFLGRQPFEVIRNHYSRCKAFIFPGEEDFGITPVEAQASGRPVIAYGKGGALETVVEGKTGIFFRDQTVEALQAAIQEFESKEDSFDPSGIRENSLKFDRSRFMEEMQLFVEKKVAEHFASFRS